MNQVVYEHFGLNLTKMLIYIHYLANKLSSNSILDSISRQAKLKHNNVFVKKLMNNETQFKYTYITIYIYTHI